MPAIFNQHYVGATVLVVFAFSGCQLPSGKWSLGLNERAKSSDRGSAASEKLADRSSGSANTSKPEDQLEELTKKGDVLRKNKQYEEARLVYQRALTLSPQSPDIHHRLAILADKQQQFSVADQHYAAALKTQPNNVNLLSDLGYSHSLRGNSEKAEKTLKKALSIDATHKGAMANLGSIYAQQDRYSEAQALFRAGTNEAEAQQYLSQLFPDRARPEVTAMAGRGRVAVKGLIDSPSHGEISDLGQLSVEELQAELERRKRAEDSGKSFVSADEQSEFDADSQGKTAQVSWDAPDESPAISDESDSKPQGVPVPSGKLQPIGNIGRIGRNGRNDLHLRPARAQSGLASADLAPSEAGQGSANPRLPRPRTSSQRATEFGLNAGPGNLFSIVPGIEVTESSHQTLTPTKPWKLMEDSDKIDLSEAESLEPVTEVTTDWDETATHRPATIATTETPTGVPAASLNGSGDMQPYEGLWPNSNQLPNQRTGETPTNPPTNERPELPKNNLRTASRITSKGSWSDTVVDADKINLDATAGRPRDTEVSEDATDSWPYASQR